MSNNKRYSNNSNCCCFELNPSIVGITLAFIYLAGFK